MPHNFKPSEQVVMNALPDATIWEIVSIQQRNLIEIRDQNAPRSKSQFVDASLCKYPTLLQLTGE